jgi:FKBP-type peptidyl-prolyl cis-trans isomerase
MKLSKNQIIILLIFLVVVIIGAGVYIINNKPKEAQNQANNLSQTSQNTSTNNTKPESNNKPTMSDTTTTTPKEEVKSLPPVTTASGLIIEDTAVGNGTEVKSGDIVKIHYTGKLTDGTVFDSSVPRNQPFETPIGKGLVIQGWDEGVVGMKVGGKRKLTIPPDLGYGARGAGAAIPPNSTLIFELELLDVKPATGR